MDFGDLQLLLLLVALALLAIDLALYSATPRQVRAEFLMAFGFAFLVMPGSGFVMFWLRRKNRPKPQEGASDEEKRPVHPDIPDGVP